jgi:hypothetical protein
MKASSAKEGLMKVFGELLAPVGGLVWLGGMGLGVYELGYWLKKGFWRHLTPESVFGPAAVNDWSGVTQIIVWIWQQPLWGVVACTGIAATLLGIALANAE